MVLKVRILPLIRRVSILSVSRRRSLAKVIRFPLCGRRLRLGLGIVPLMMNVRVLMRRSRTMFSAITSLMLNRFTD